MIVLMHMLFRDQGNWKSAVSVKVEGVTTEQLELVNKRYGGQDLLDPNYSWDLFGHIDTSLARAMGYKDICELREIHEQNCDVRGAPSIEAVSLFDNEDAYIAAGHNDFENRVSPVDLPKLMGLLYHRRG